MQYQLPSGKVINISVEQYLALTDEEIQYLISIEYGEHISNPFTDSAAIEQRKDKTYDFDYLPDDEDTDAGLTSDDIPFDDIIDLTDPFA
jgi:hypothetical protein